MDRKLIRIFMYIECTFPLYLDKPLKLSRHDSILPLRSLITPNTPSLEPWEEDRRCPLPSSLLPLPSSLLPLLSSDLHLLITSSNFNLSLTILSFSILICFCFSFNSFFSLASLASLSLFSLILFSFSSLAIRSASCLIFASTSRRFFLSVSRKSFLSNLALVSASFSSLKRN